MGKQPDTHLREPLAEQRVAVDLKQMRELIRAAHVNRQFLGESFGQRGFATSWIANGVEIK